MAQGVLLQDDLQQLVEDYLEFDEFVFDVETKGSWRGEPSRNEVFWISLAGPGRADAIPCGHPVGERIEFDLDDPDHRITKTGHYQEHKVNPDTGRIKWFDVPPQFTEAPKQLWVSDVMEALRPLMFSPRRKIGHNVKFDILSIAKYYGEIPPPPYGDTLIAAKLINENYIGGRPYSLGQLVKRFFKFEYDKSIGKQVEAHPYSEAYLYSYLDAKYTWLLWRSQQDKLLKEGIDHIFDLEMALLPAILDIEHIGVRIDPDALAKLGQEFAMELAKLEIAIDDVAGEHVNLNANRQVAHLVYDILDKPCKVYTPSGERSTSKETLESFGKNKTVQKVLEHAKYAKLQSTFIVGITEKMHDGKIHPDFDQTGARTGRMSCRSPNIQQIPVRSTEGKKIRGVFVASPKRVLVVADLSQIELRVLAHFTQDPQLLRAYRKGLDLHAITAARAFGKDFTALDRTFAKNMNFSVVYGAGALTLVRRYGVPSLRLAQQLLDAFYSTYRRVDPWKDEVLYIARKHYKKGTQAPYVETILGRKRRIPELVYVDRNLRAGGERQAISSIIQGSAADLFKVALLQCYKSLAEVSWEGHVLMLVHDEMVVEVPKRYADEGLALVKESMENIINPFTDEPILSLPITADAKIVERWGDAKS